MSDTPIVDQQGNPVEEAPVEQAVQQPEPTVEELKPEDIQCGYVVAIKQSGEFVFETLGTNCGLIQLLGIHKYAEHRLMLAKDINQKHGFPVVTQQLNEIGRMLQVLLNLATQQTKSGMVPSQQ